jgi:hypothetical protein
LEAGKQELGEGMRAVASLSGLALLAALSACAPMSVLPDMSLFGGGNADTAAATGPETASVEVAAAPPLPTRDLRKRRVKQGTQLASGPRPKEEKPNEEKPAEDRQASLALPGLPDVKLFAAAAYAPDSVNWDGAPVAVYTQLAQQIRACWLAPTTTKLTKHGFHAEVSPDSSNAKIVIYEKDPQGKRGVQAFRINISGGSSGSSVQSENRRLDKTLDVAFKADLARWSKGNQGCKG